MIANLKLLVQNKGFMRYFQNTSWLMAEKIIRMGVGFFVSVWIARYLGPDQFGMLMEEGNPLKSCVDEALNTITGNGILASIEAQWLQDTTGVPLIK